PLVTLLRPVFRYALRRSLHRRRAEGACTRRVVAVGHGPSIDELVRLFRCERYHGLDVVAACLPDGASDGDVTEVPVAGHFSDVPLVVDQVGDERDVAERSEEHTSELQSRENLVCRLLLEKKKEKNYINVRANHKLE